MEKSKILKNIGAVAISAAITTTVFSGCSSGGKNYSHAFDLSSVPDISHSSVSTSSKSDTSAHIEFSGDSTLVYTGTTSEGFTVKIPIKNVGENPINGFQIMTNDLGAKNFSILSVSDNPKIKKDTLAQYITWDKVLQQGESYEIDVELQPMQAQKKKARLFLQDTNGKSMLINQTKDSAFITLDLSIK